MAKMIKALIWEHWRLTCAPLVLLIAIGAGLDLCVRILSAFNHGLLRAGGLPISDWDEQSVWTRLAAAFNLDFWVAKWQFIQLANWCMFGVLAISGAVLLIAHADREDLRLGFPARIYRLPLPSWAIAGPTLAYRMLAAGAQFALVLFIHRHLMGSCWDSYSGVSDAQVGMCMFCLYACIQGLTGLGNWIGSWLAAVLSILFVGALVAIGVPVIEFVRSHPVASITFSVALACAMTLGGFHLGRRGAVAWPQLRLPSVAKAPSRRSKQRPFASAAAAQAWFEWRSNGLVLPCALVLCLGLLLLGGELFSAWGRHHRYAVLSALPAYMGPAQLVAAFAAGLFVTFREYRSVRSGLGRFLLTRPLHPTEMAAVKMRVAMRGILITVALQVVIYLAWLLLIPGMFALVHTLVTASPLSFALIVFQRLALWVLALWLLFWAWNRLNFILAVAFAIPFMFDEFGKWLEQIAAAYAPWLPLNPIPAILMVVGAGVAFILAYRRGLLSGKTISCVCFVWLLAVCVLVPHSLEYYQRTFLSAGFAALTLAPIALVPLTERRRRSA